MAARLGLKTASYIALLVTIGCEKGEFYSSSAHSSYDVPSGENDAGFVLDTGVYDVDESNPSDVEPEHALTPDSGTTDTPINDSFSDNGEGENCFSASAEIKTDFYDWSSNVSVYVNSSIQLRFLTDDPRRRITQVLWALLDAPSPFVENHAFRPSPSSRSPLYDILSVGRHVFEVSLVDQFGQTSCMPVQCVVMGVPLPSVPQLKIEAVWEAPPGHPEEVLSSTADLDLHLLHLDGVWNTSPFDCHWLNPDPAWGDNTTPLDDPVFDDSQAGEGWRAEYITLFVPEQLPYRVGVFVNSDRNYGPLSVAIRFYVNGRLYHVIESERLSVGQFWEAASVHWSEQPQIQNVSRSTNGFP